MKKILPLIVLLIISLIGGGFYFAFHTSKNTILQPTKQAGTPRKVSLPDSETLENAIAQYGIVAKTSLIQFNTGEAYAVVCSAVSTYDNGESGSNAQIFVLRNIANTDNWQMIWKLPKELKTIWSVDGDFPTGINKVMNGDSALVAIGVPQGIKDGAALNVVQINKNGEVILQKREEVSGLNISVKDNNLIAITDSGIHQMSLNTDNVFTDIIQAPIQVGQEKSNNTNIYFTLQNGSIIPNSDKNITIKVGSTVTFVESTGKKFSVYTNGFYKDDPVGMYETFYLKVPYFTFKETGKVDFIIVSQNEVFSENHPPTYSVNVVK